MKAEQIPAINAAIAAVEALLEQRHPVAHRPPWFGTSVARSERMTGEQTLEIRYYAEQKVPLPADQAWEASANGPILIHTNPATGERRAVITRDTNPFIDLFAATANLESGVIEVTADMDFNTLDPETIEHPR